MNTLYIDIMIADRFYKQVAYKYSPIFSIDQDDLINHIFAKCPELKKEKRPWHIIEGKKVFR